MSCFANNSKTVDNCEENGTTADKTSQNFYATQNSVKKTHFFKIGNKVN